ncbi:MAG: chemotaxis response regulator protein-glutamate methylesterase [Halanaerobacter sp.]
MAKKIEVLIVDDSAVVRNLLKEILESSNGIEVIGAAGDPYQAVKKIKKKDPDVITLDVEMPKMSGLKFLKKLMATYPLPVVMISSLTKQGSNETIKALEYGAVDFVAKSNLQKEESKKKFAREVIRKVKLAAGVKVKKIKKNLKSKRPLKAKKSSKNESKAKQKLNDKYVIGIGASTGGVKALKNLMPFLPANCPGIVIVQHMPKEFTHSFANTLDRVAKVDVKEAEAGDKIKAGQALLAPGDQHVKINKKGSNYYVGLDNGAKVNHQRPAVDVTFKSLAQTVKHNTIGVLLTGMGSDGAQGLKEIKEKRGYTIAESEKSATIFGMPKKAIDIGAVDKILSLTKIPKKIISRVK